MNSSFVPRALHKCFPMVLPTFCCLLGVSARHEARASTRFARVVGFFLPCLFFETGESLAFCRSSDVFFLFCLPRCLLRKFRSVGMSLDANAGSYSLALKSVSMWSGMSSGSSFLYSKSPGAGSTGTTCDVHILQR